MGINYLKKLKLNRLSRKFILAGFSSVFFIAFIGSIPLPKTKSDLGKKLFFDKRLSKNNQVSCASCHRPEFAFADTSALSRGVYDRLGKRNSPSVMNMASREVFFYDGRAKTLEEQASFPIQDHNEMDILVDVAFDRIVRDKLYQRYFKSVYGELPNRINILNAIAEFERTLESTSPFDKYMAGDEKAISVSAKRGHQLFLDPKNKCFECHFTPDFTGDEFRNIGLFDGAQYNDSGRYLVTKNLKDIGKFKVPGLRNVAVTKPYMHDGSMKTLKEVIRYYNNIYTTVSHPINEDSLVKQKLNLTETDVTDIENFLISLTDPQYKHLLHGKNSNHRRGKPVSTSKKKIR
jgi:cytochrome c peroxidase